MNQPRTLLLVAIVIAGPSAGAAQSDPVAAGRAAMEAMDLPSARRNLEAAVAADAGHYEANWRLAIVFGEMGELIGRRTCLAPTGFTVCAVRKVCASRRGRERPGR